MAKFKKALALLLVVTITAGIAIAGTVAFLTDTDAQVNTFTSGNVAIDLWEDFGDNDEVGIEHLIPTTGKDADGAQINGVEKEVYVTNTGSEDAFVRVHIAIPSILDNANDASANALHFNYNKDNVGAGLWDWSKTSGEAYTGDWNMYVANVDGIDYNVYVVTYESALHSGDTTVDAIWQVYMDSGVTNEMINSFNAELGNEWKILVAAEAGQAAGYGDAYTALNAQFGVPGDYAIADWDLRKNIVFAESEGAVVRNFAELKEAFANGGKVMLGSDIVLDEIIIMPEGNYVELNMNGKTITPGNAAVDPLIEMKAGSTLIVDGNGTVDLGEYKGMSFIVPRGDVTIKNGTFLRVPGGSSSEYGSFFVGINGGKGKLVIEDGYFDGGYYAEGDCFNNCRSLLNCSWGQYIRVYGGTFVAQNPAWGDEGMADLCPHCTSTYCQGIFFDGQTKDSAELPAGYSISEGTTADGRPTYTVNYSN